MLGLYLTQVACPEFGIRAYYIMYYNIIILYHINFIRTEYDVKLLQGRRTVRVLLNKNRYVPAPVKGGLIKQHNIQLNIYGQYKVRRFFYRRQPFFPHTLGLIC